MGSSLYVAVDWHGMGPQSWHLGTAPTMLALLFRPSFVCHMSHAINRLFPLFPPPCRSRKRSGCRRTRRRGRRCPRRCAIAAGLACCFSGDRPAAYVPSTSPPCLAAHPLAHVTKVATHPLPHPRKHPPSHASAPPTSRNLTYSQPQSNPAGAAGARAGAAQGGGQSAGKSGLHQQPSHRVEVAMKRC